MRALRRLLPLAVAAALVARAAPSRAAEDAEALIARGVELREQGKDDEALEVFRRAYALAPSPRARAQVALAEQALGLWVAAESDLVAALAAADDPWIGKHRQPLEGALAVIRRHLGSLEVRGTEGAEVALDGVKLGVLPAAAPFRVEAGRRTLSLQARGHHATSRIIEVPAGGVARETVELVPLPPEAPASAGAKGETPASAPDVGRGQRLLGWTFVGAGGVLLAAGGVSLLVRKGFIDDYNADATCPGIGSTRPQPPACDDRIEASRTWQTVSIVSFVAGGAFALGGAALVLTAPRASRTTALACGPAGLAGIRCAARF